MARVHPAWAGSLSLRLLAFAGGAIAFALVLAWMVLGVLFERHAERQLEAELERHGLALIAVLSLDSQGRPRLERLPSDPRFSRPGSGLYWLLAAPGGQLRSRSLWDGQVVPPLQDGADGWRSGTSQGPFERSVLTVGRSVQPDPAGPVVEVVIAADRGPLTRARTAFDRETGIFLAILWALLAAAAWVQVRLGLRPLTGIRNELEDMSRTAEARLELAAHPVEIRPLSEAINRVASQRAEDIMRARQRARDLAHALKTPLTALRLQTAGLPPDMAREMMHSLSLVSGAVESELARTGLKPQGGSTEAGRAVERILAVVARAGASSDMVFHARLPDGLHVPLDEDSALELLGAVIENAARHAQARVEISGGTQAGKTWVAIEDDGPGIPADMREQALARGGRLDEKSGSHGLGLAIARELVSASGGTLSLDRSGLGGLAVRMSWIAHS